MTKAHLFNELKSYLAREIARVQDELKRGQDDSRSRVYLSDNTENLRALEKSARPEDALTLLELEEKKFDGGKVISARTYWQLIAEVPHTLPESMALPDRTYVLAKFYPEYRNLAAGSVWQESFARNERDLVLQVVVKTKI